MEDGLRGRCCEDDAAPFVLRPVAPVAVCICAHAAGPITINASTQDVNYKSGRCILPTDRERPQRQTRRPKFHAWDDPRPLKSSPPGLAPRKL
eukprot:3342087-Pyramimonas_sp.AAC.1